MSKEYDLSKWNDVDVEGYPTEGQKVYYYFEHTGFHKGEYYKHFYEEICEGGYWFHCFQGKDGFLCDDVTHWIPVEWVDIK